MRPRPRVFAAALLAGTLAACASVPTPIAAEQRAAPPGHVVVVEFVDFECPFCRRMHASLGAVAARHAPLVHLVRKHVPLTAIHPHALTAAKVSICADALGRGDVVADALFRAPAASLTPDGAIAIGAGAGLDADALHACMDGARTRRRIDGDTATFAAVGGEGVPLVFIGRERFEGAEDEDVLEAAVTRSLSEAR